MRKSKLVDALFPRARQQVLSTLLLDPDHAWYLSDLAKHHRTSPSSLQRELASLVEAGILIKSRDGNRAYFQADLECPVFSDLRGLLFKTVGLSDQVKEALTPLEALIRLAFIFGSVAASAERSLSDVDLLVVGTAKLADLSRVLKPLEARLSRVVHPSLFTEREFRDKLGSGHHFVTSLIEGPKLFIIGDHRDLAAIAERRASAGTSDEQRGAR